MTLGQAVRRRQGVAALPLEGAFRCELQEVVKTLALVGIERLYGHLKSPIVSVKRNTLACLQPYFENAKRSEPTKAQLS
jgi:hypothetical protein